MFLRLKSAILAVALVLFSATVFADTTITDETIDVFLKVYPKYVTMARESNIMPNQSTMNQWGDDLEQGSFDFSQIASQNQDVKAFSSKLESMLASYGMSVEDFSALAAKISVIYSNVTVRQAMSGMDDAEMGSLNAYTEQFDQALSSVGIDYNDSETTVVEKNIERLNDLFAKVLLGESE